MAFQQVTQQIPNANSCMDAGTCIANDNISGYMQSVHGNVNAYVENVHKDALYNQTYNATKYMENELRSQNKKMDDLVSKSDRQIHATMSRAGIAEYAAHQYQFYSRAAQFFLFAVASCGLLFAYVSLGTVSQRTAMIAASTIVVSLAVALFVATRLNLSRRKDAWDKFYWESVRNGVKSNASCAQ